MDNGHAQIIDRQRENARSFNRKPLKIWQNKNKKNMAYEMNTTRLIIKDMKAKINI